MSRGYIIQEKLNFFSILLCIINSILNGSEEKNTLTSLPVLIGKYRLIHPILEDKTPKYYQFGIYQDLDGKRAIAKQWSGKRKNLSYYWLINEINAYRGIWYLYKRSRNMQKRYPHIHFPKLITVRKESNRLIILLEEIRGKFLQELEVPARMPIYEEMISFFQELGNHLDASTSQIFRRRTPWAIGILFLIHLTRAVIKHPKWLPSLGKAAILFAIRFPKLVKDKDISLVHRDLLPWNVILKDKEIWIIDLQLLTITHRMLELVSLNLRRWGDPSHWYFFKKTQTMRIVLNNPNSFFVYQALAIYISIFNLANHYSIPHKIAYDYLNYWLKK